MGIFTIDSPVDDDVPADCSSASSSSSSAQNEAKVCCKGTDAKRGTEIAAKVFAKIYKSPSGPTHPQNGPPSDAAQCTPDQTTGEWCIGWLGGVVADQTDYTVYAWAQFPESSSSSSSGGSGFSYIYINASFTAKCSNNLPDCCGTSSSSSSSSG